MNIKKLGSGLDICYHKTTQFKTSVVTLNLITPLDDKASEKALLVHLLARTNRGRIVTESAYKHLKMEYIKQPTTITFLDNEEE